VALVMKLSEARFKPLFLRFLEWANASPPDGGRLSRAVLLFAGAEALAARLRSVFVPYFTYLVDAALLHLSPAAAGEPGSEGKAAKKKRRKEGRAKEAESAADGSGMSEEDEVEAWVLRLKVGTPFFLSFRNYVSRLGI
jgi:U3 small nucleolar RNA-associated protein 10